MVGASGAIAGVMGAYLVKFPRARILTLVFVLFFLPPSRFRPGLLAILVRPAVVQRRRLDCAIQPFAGRHGLFRARRRLPGRHGAGQRDGHRERYYPAATYR